MRVERSIPAYAVAAQFVRFGVVGLVNTAVSFGVFALLVALGVWYPGASALAFAVGALNGYTLNRIWTFRAGAFQMAGLARYLLVQLVALGVNLALLVALVEWVGLGKHVAQVIALAAVALLSFGLTRRWAFGARS